MANRIFILSAALFGAAAIAGAAPRRPPDIRFSVEPSTVTAGRTITVLCFSEDPLLRPAVYLGNRKAPLFQTTANRWRAHVGISPREAAGPKEIVFYTEWGRGQVIQSSRTFSVQPGAYPMSRLKLPKKASSLVETGEMRQDAEFLAAFYSGVYTSTKNWSGIFIMPTTGTITSVFGARRSYGGNSNYASHTGVDIASHTGTAIVAPAGGVVVYSGWLNSFGNSVVLDHGQGVFTYYLHMTASAVRAGQKLRPGELIGRMGAEGVATGPHLHWSMVVAGERVDPLEWTERPFD